jgi:hypothetical protein
MKYYTKLLILGFKRMRRINKGDFHRNRTITAFKTGASKGMRALAVRFGRIELDEKEDR